MDPNNRPPLPSNNPSQTTLNDPFSDRQHLTFQEPSPSAFASTTSLTDDFGGQRQSQYDDEEIEKMPLTSGGMYPPG